MPAPKISVIIPVYNRAHCVKRAVDSVLAQTFKDIEVIVVDDGSQDGSANILKTYGDAIRLICQKNAGAGTARNTGIRAAQGEWIAFLDSDDEWRPEKLAYQLQITGKYGFQVCFSRCESEDGKPMPDLEHVSSQQKEPGVFVVLDPLEFLTKSPTHPYLQSMLAHKKLFEQVGLFDQSLHTGEDTLWLFRLSFLGEALYVDRPMTIINRFTDNSLTYDLRPEQAVKRINAFMRMQAEMYWRLLAARPEQSVVTRGRLAYWMACRSELACAAGQNKLARTLAWEALCLAGDIHTFIHSGALWLVPGLCRGHFRKKWNFK